MVGEILHSGFSMDRREYVEPTHGEYHRFRATANGQKRIPPTPLPDFLFPIHDFRFPPDTGDAMRNRRKDSEWEIANRK